MIGREETFEVLVYPESYKTKAEAVTNTGKIKRRILRFRQNLTLAGIAEKSVTGFVMSFIGTGTEKGTLSTRVWKNQRVFALDCDNTYPGGEKLKEPYYLDCRDAASFAMSKGIKPAFIYTTGSSTADHNKFRIVFVLDKAVTSEEERERIIRGLFSLFSRDGIVLADQRCSDAGRVFYPGKDLIYEDYKARVEKDFLLDKAQKKLPDEGIKNKPQKVFPEIKTETVNRAAESIRAELETLKKESSLRKACLETLDLRDFLDKDFRVAVENLIYNISFNKKGNNISGSKLTRQKAESETPLQVGNPEVFFAICRSIDFGRLLNLPVGRNFSCIFHEDRKPSAHIVKFNGTYFYKCFSCGHCLNIFGVFEKLFGADFGLTLKWISRKFNIVYESEWQKVQKEHISLYRDYMLGDSVKKTHPVLAGYLEKCRLVPLFAAIADLARMYVIDREDEKIDFNLFYMAQNVLVRVMNRKYGLRKSRASLQKGIVKLAHLGLVRILGDEMLPADIKQHLYALKKEKHKFRISVYSIPMFSMELMDKAERQVIRDREKGIRSGTLSREGLLRSSGENEAGKVFVQSAGRKRDKKTEEFFVRYKKAAEVLVAEKGWTTEQNILNRMKWPSNSEKKRLSAVCLPQLLIELNLKRTAYSKELEGLYNVKARRKLVYGISKIIVSK